jgi:two-component system chemotaxis response regulator CheY
MGMSVLVVDDSRAMRLLVGLALRRAGHEVTEAADGVEALAALADSRFACIVCDLNMPRMDGLTFLGRLRSLPEHRETPVCMLTTESGTQAVREGQAGGVRAWIVKPFVSERLVEAVSRAARA